MHKLQEAIMILTPTQMRNIFYHNGGEGSYETWTQIESLKQYAPAERSVYMFYKGTIIVGASAGSMCKTELHEWRRMYSLRYVPTPDNIEYKKEIKPSPMIEQWMVLYTQGFNQSEIAGKLGISRAYCSQLKKRYKKELDNTQ